LMDWARFGSLKGNFSGKPVGQFAQLCGESFSEVFV
jgi:hypothetical protein